MHDQFRHIKTNAASADYSNSFAHITVTLNHIDVADNRGMINPFNIGFTRRDPGGHNHMIKTLATQLLSGDSFIEANIHLMFLQHVPVVAQGLIKLFFTRNLLGKIKLTANLTCRIK